jgi:large subunit ribosomal protein L13
MLPYRKARGREAFSRLKVHIGVPEEMTDTMKISIQEARASMLDGRYVTVGEIASNIGWKK